MLKNLVRKEDGNYVISIEAVGSLIVAIGIALLITMIGVIVPMRIIPEWYYQANAHTGETELNMLSHLLICAAVVVAAIIGFVMGVNNEE